MKPACMTDHEYALWAEANERISATSNRAVRPCGDCPAAHALAERAAGRCDGVPGMRVRKPITPALLRRRVQWAEAQARRRAKVAA